MHPPAAQHGAVVEGLAAIIIATTDAAASVDALVLQEVRELREGLAALETLVWASLCVWSCDAERDPNSPKGLSTPQAREGFARVDPLVLSTELWLKALPHTAHIGPLRQGPSGWVAGGELRLKHFP